MQVTGTVQMQGTSTVQMQMQMQRTVQMQVTSTMQMQGTFTGLHCKCTENCLQIHCNNMKFKCHAIQ